MGLWSRLQATFRPRDLDARLDDELQFHIEMRASDLKAAGHSESEALAMARRQFGNATSLREEAREIDMLTWIEDCARDFRLALRSLRKRPVFTLTAIGSVAIGIGAVTSLFSVVDAVVWQPIALPDSRQLVFIDEFKKGVRSGSNGARLKDWQTLSSFASATGFYGENFVWRGVNGNERLPGLRIYSGAGPTLKISTILGRPFTTREEAGEPVALLSETFWRRRFNADPRVIEQSLQLDDRSYRVVGVVPASTTIERAVDVWVPADAGLQNGSRKAGYLGVVARLKPGVDPPQAQAEVNAVAARLRSQYPDSDAGLQAALIPLRDRISQEARTPLLLLLGVVASVLLMIAVNLSALLLARASERRRESALRSALGASTASLIRSYLAEPLLIAFSGAAVGLLLASAGIDSLKAFLPGDIPRLAAAHLDLRVLGFAVLLAFAVALLAGLMPAFIAARQSSLKEDARTTASRQNLWLRSAFVVGQIALGCLLTTTAVRMAESFTEMNERARAVQTASKLAVTVPFSWDATSQRVHSFNQAALERFAALPGTTQVGLIDRLPLGGGTQSGEIEIEGIVLPGAANAGKRAASSSYFAALGVPLRTGRLFEDRKGRNEVVVNDTFVRRFVNGGNPIGRRVRMAREKTWYEIVGTVGNIRKDAAQPEAEPEIYLYYQNTSWPISNFVIQTTAPLAVVAPLIRKEVQALDSMVIVDRLSTLDDALGEATKETRVRSYLVGGFALLALLLAGIGIHGVFAADVAARWKEFGVRLALGGSVSTLRNLLLKRAAWMLTIGGSIGVAAVLTTSKLLESAVEGLQPARLAAISSAGALLLLAALAAIWWPIRRLSRVDPSAILRHE